LFFSGIFRWANHFFIFFGGSIFILPQSGKDGMAQDLVFCPFREFHLADKFRPQPGSWLVGVRHCLKWTFIRYQRLKFLRQFFQVFIIETGPAVPDVYQLLSLVFSQEDGAKKFPAPPGKGKAANDGFHTVTVLHLQPAAAARAHLVGAIAFFSHDAFQAMPDGRRQEPGGWNRIVLYVDDLEALVDRLRGFGTTFRNDVEVGPGGKQIQILDPDGNPIEIHEAPA